MFSKLASPAWAVMEYGWYPLLAFIATPYLLHTLGTENYGLWMLLGSIMGVGGILSVGTGTATIKNISAGLGQADMRDVEITIRSSLAIALIGGGALAALMFGVFWFAGHTFFEKMGDQSVIGETAGVGVLLAWIEQIDNVFASALKGAEQFGRAARIEMASKTAQIITSVLAVWAWGSLTALYIALTLVAVARLITKLFMVKRYFDLATMRPTFANVVDILHYAKWGWLHGVGGVLFSVADRLLIGSFLGATSLSYYSVASQLAQQIHSLPAAGLSVLFPKISRKLESDPKFSLWRVTMIAIMANAFLTSTLAIVLLVFNYNILSLWLGKPTASASTEVLWYLTIAYWILAANIVPHFVLLGLGKMRFVALSNLAAGVALVVVMYFALPSQGLAGVGLARIAYGIVSLIVFIPIIGFFRRKLSTK
jgi:O-antigen/teichoic acid export membrane protein